MRRVMDVCHGCRACFNLCDSFPTLFNLIDKSTTQELNSVQSTDFAKVEEKCTLCDACYFTCPYAPSHHLNIDFPHLILRYRHSKLAKETKGANDQKNDDETDFYWPHKDTKAHTLPGVSRSLFAPDQSPQKWHPLQEIVTKTDLLGGMSASVLSSVVNWAIKHEKNGKERLPRKIINKLTGIHPQAALPLYESVRFSKNTKKIKELTKINEEGPSRKEKEKAILFPSCLCEYQKSSVAEASLYVLSHNGVDATDVYYERCCGMPSLEKGDIKNVAESAIQTSKTLVSKLDSPNCKIVTPTASCALMMKKEWPLIVPDDQNVKKVAASAMDISEYIVYLSKKNGLTGGLKPLSGPVSIHQACHMQAQNIGFKSRDMLRLIPSIKLNIVGQCSGHGGSWGAMEENFETALKVGAPATNNLIKHIDQSNKNNQPNHYVSSDCPLATDHLVQSVELKKSELSTKLEKRHPIELLAMSYRS